jgi:hypothetical protein
LHTWFTANSHLLLTRAAQDRHSADRVRTEEAKR